MPQNANDRAFRLSGYYRQGEPFVCADRSIASRKPPEFGNRHAVSLFAPGDRVRYAVPLCPGICRKFTRYPFRLKTAFGPRPDPCSINSLSHRRPKMFQSISRLSLAVALCLITSSCFAQSDSWKDVLLGKWKCNVDETMKLMKESGVNEAQMDMMKELMGAMQMELTAENMIMSMMGQDNKASYTIEESDEEKNWVKVKVTMEGQPEPKIGEFTILGKDALKLKADDGTSIVFARIKDEEKKDD
jgi:hypothetical protein